MDRNPGIRPPLGPIRRLDAVARAAFPAASTVLLLLILPAPLDLPAQAELAPAMLLGCIFFWSLVRPASMSAPLVFALGLLSDLLGDTPIGVTILILLIVHGLAVRWRPVLVEQGFLLVWFAYVAVVLGAAALDWALCSILAFMVLPPAPIVFEAVLAAGIYPAWAMLLSGAHRAVATAEPP